MLRRNTELQRSEDGTVTAPEQTHPGPVYSPPVDIFESEDRISLLADMPGVKAKDLKIDLRENVLTLSAPVTPPESPSEASVLWEYATGSYFRRFTLSDQIDQARIDAKLTDGVLRLELPKLEKAKPRQITVQAS